MNTTDNYLSEQITSSLLALLVYRHYNPGTHRIQQQLAKKICPCFTEICGHTFMRKINHPPKH
jgi:hypothetical protein